MFNARRTALYVALGAMGLAAGGANAGCRYIPNPPGSLVCASWISGSEICDILLTGINTPDPAVELTSATCNVTGFNFFDGAEGSLNSSGIFCASGDLPPGNLVCGSKPKKNAPTETTTTLVTPFTIGGPAPTGTGKGPCKHVNDPTPGNAYGHFNHDCVPDIIFPSGYTGPFDTFSADATGSIECTGAGNTLKCTASAEIVPPAGSMCQNGGTVLDFTATQMLAYVDFCVLTSTGEQCGTIFDACTLQGDGTYNCIDISDQPEFGPDPLSSSCGEVD